MSALKELSDRNSLFNLGDRVLAVHVQRTARLNRGETLFAITADLAKAFGIDARIVPVTNDRPRTMILSGQREMMFQQYVVEKRCEPSVLGFRFYGAERAAVTPAIVDVARDGIGVVVICPSNPFVSVDPVLGVPQLVPLLRKSGAPVVAVSPIVGGRAIRGPAANMFTEQGLDCSALGIARHYAGFIDGLVKTDIDKVGLAHRVPKFANSIALETRGVS